MKYTDTQLLVYKMLTENTGSQWLDSGDYYGRNHERNARKTISDFDDELPETITLDKNGNIERTVNLFHYLSGLELDDLCDRFNRIQANSDNWDADADIYGVSTEAWNYLTKNNDVKIIRTFNSYNGESDLSQVIQGSWLTINENEYLLLQIHGGCDVRGGYTDAKLFKTVNNDGLIHEYLLEYMDQREIIENISDGYIEPLDPETLKPLTQDQVNARLNN